MKNEKWRIDNENISKIGNRIIKILIINYSIFVFFRSVGIKPIYQKVCGADFALARNENQHCDVNASFAEIETVARNTYLVDQIV